MIFFIESFVISLLSAFTNTILGKGIFGIILQWSYVLLCTIILFVPLDLRMRLSKPLLVFITFAYIPFLFFQTAGYYGTALLFSLLGIFLLAVVFKGKERIALILLNILFYIICSLLQFCNPDWVIPHGTEGAKLIDFLVALTLSATGLAIMTVYISNAFDIERMRIKRLLSRLEETNKTLADLTNRDALTGVYNRRYLTQFMRNELDKNERTGNSLCLLSLDLDNFKLINDTYGHGFGDEVLVAFTRVLQSHLRKYDILARTGGEEFVIVLHDMDAKKARGIAERARIQVSELDFSNEVKITVSIGVVESMPGESIDSLCQRADQNLYRAKRGGRNRVISE